MLSRFCLFLLLIPLINQLKWICVSPRVASESTMHSHIFTCMLVLSVTFCPVLLHCCLCSDRSGHRNILWHCAKHMHVVTCFFSLCICRAKLCTRRVQYWRSNSVHFVCLSVCHTQVLCLTCPLPDQFFPACHPQVGLCRGASWLSAVLPVYGWVTCTEWRVYSSVALILMHIKLTR